ncbi:tetratricopeptide repeat protein [Algiphilus sp.]|uniref:tetratricopeptide repeat protein n=1 Tax=Algiphilus sp. TaxID=1872431 RepID=UPI003BA85997
MPLTRALAASLTACCCLTAPALGWPQDTPTQSVDTGAELLAEGYTVRAIAQLEHALGRNPFDPVVLNNLAAAYSQRGDYARAQNLLQRAQRLSPEDPTIRSNLDATREWLNHLADRSEAQQRERAREVRQNAQEPLRIPPAPPPLWEPPQRSP